MRLGYTILYVDEVSKTLEAWCKAFGLELDYEDETGVYGELETGETTLAFADREFGRGHFEDESARAIFDGAPRRFEIGLVTEDVSAAYERATKAGMQALKGPEEKPWGQVVAWVRDANGILIELSSVVD